MMTDALIRGTRDMPSIEGQVIVLMDCYEAPIYRFLVSLVRDPEAALDCCQDTFLRAYQNLARGKPVTAAWLYRVARNRAMDEFRRSRRLCRGDDLLEAVPVAEPTDTAATVQQVWEKLPRADREVLYLFVVAGFTTAEIGAMLGVQATAVRTRLYRARERFRLLYGSRPDGATG